MAARYGPGTGKFTGPVGDAKDLHTTINGREAEGSSNPHLNEIFTCAITAHSSWLRLTYQHEIWEAGETT